MGAPKTHYKRFVKVGGGGGGGPAPPPPKTSKNVVARRAGARSQAA